MTPGEINERIEGARAALLAALEDPQPLRRTARTKADEVELLRNEIGMLRARGATWSGIAKALKPMLDVSADTIRAVIGARKAQPKRTRVPAERGAAPEPRRTLPTQDATKTQPTTPTSRRFGSHDL